VTSAVDISVDFMDMTDDGRLWTRLSDVRSGFVPVAGRFAVVGDEDRGRVADPRGRQRLPV